MKQSLLLTVLMGSALVGLTACVGSQPTPIASPTAPAISQNSPTPTPTPSSTPSTPAATASPTQDVAVPAQEPIRSTQPPESVKIATGPQEITVYKLDDQCNDFIPEKVAVPAESNVDAAVSKVLENSNSPDFNISNYRVDVKEGVATVDLRLPDGAKRPFEAMSACEQKGLIGSLDKTLKANPNLKVNAVRYTDGKKELEF